MTATDTSLHTCPSCATFLPRSERRPSGFRTETSEHRHVCPNCRTVWWHRNPRLDSAGLLPKPSDSHSPAGLEA